MGARLILETTFLIDLERERRRGAGGTAQEALARLASDRLFVTFTVAGELAAGASLADRAAWESFLAPFHVLPCTRDVCWEYGRVLRHLQQNGLLIGANDLWIGATALAHGMPVVTANAEHYRRLPGLEVVAYRS
jgi:predicted nucleic acid-binding protein